MPPKTKATTPEIERWLVQVVGTMHWFDEEPSDPWVKILAYGMSDGTVRWKP